MSVVFTFHAKDGDLPAIQRVVKRHDLRFLGNPAAALGLGSVLVRIEDNNATPAAWCEATAEINAIRYPEPPPVVKQGWFRRLLAYTTPAKQ